MADTLAKRSSKASIALAWLIVVLPLGWGLTYTVSNALKLFTVPAPASLAPIAK